MDDSQDKPDYFQHRWGVKEWDVGATTIPNPILVHYSRVPWIDKDGKSGRGISNQEMLCIVHLASFHYESEKGESRPAIGTVARRMGYRKDDSVRSLIKSLEDKNLLTVERRPGKCSIYDLSNFSNAILKLDAKQPPHSNGGLHPNGGLSNGGHSSGPHSQGDEEKKVLEEGKQEEKEEKKKEEGISIFPEKPEPTPSPGGGVDSGKEIDDDEKVELGHVVGNSRGDRNLDDSQIAPLDSHDDSSGKRMGTDDRAGADSIGADPIVESIADDFLNKPSPEDLARATVAARAEAGGNWADPGEDGVAHAGLVALHKAKGGSAPRKGTGTYDKEIGAIRQALSDRGVADPRVAVMAAQMFVKEKPKLACPHYKSFVGDYGEYLGRAGERVDKADARAPSRSPPEEYEPVYGGDLESEEGTDQTPWNLTLDCLRAQVGQTTFFSYYRGTRLLSLDDGTAVVQARDGPQADFLQNRAKVIGKELSRILDCTVEVRFEIQEGS